MLARTRGALTWSDVARHLLLRRLHHAIARGYADWRGAGNLASSREGSHGSDGIQDITPVIHEYERRVSRGSLLFDPWQRRAAKKLTRLQRALQGYDHAAHLAGIDWRDRSFDTERGAGRDRRRGVDGQPEETPTSEEVPPHAPVPVPRGFYLHGAVGRGKSLLLDTFYNHAPLESGKKRRLHFHAFLQEIHRRIHELNAQLLHAHGRSFHVDTARTRNPILRVAAKVSREITLIVIDEFQVTDVADAMILAQFFGELWRRGVVVAATSNRPPHALYEDGLNRDYFLPFVDALERHCVVHRLGEPAGGRGGGKDYRRIRSGVDAPRGDGCGDHFYLTRDREGTEGEAARKMDRLFHSFRRGPSFQDDAKASRPLVLPVNFQRTISVSQYYSNVVARFTFHELCTTELGSSDYRAIANHFRIVLISDIPWLTLRHPDRARRFITLIDELYEAGCCLACSAVDIPDRLFEKNIGQRSTAISSGDSSVPLDVANNNGPVDVAQVQGTAVCELASVKELSFAFSRAASRLLEMCSNTWWEEKGVNSNGKFINLVN